MKRMIVGLGLLLLFLPGLANAAGTVETLSFYSDAMDEERHFQIYLPEGYRSNGQGPRYPVVYYLHGLSGSHETYPFLPELLDNLIASREIRPVIVVKPDGRSGPWWDASYWTNSVIAGYVEDSIVKELVPYVDSHYKTIPGRHHRAISGHSMGGYGSMSLALKHPDVFGAAAPMSGFHDWDIYMETIRPVILANNDGPPYDYWPITHFYTAAPYTLSAVFAYNPDNPPFFLDLPLDADGEFIESVMDRYRLNDCRYLAAELQRDLSIYLDCGTYDDVDDYAAYPTNVSFDQFLDEIGLPHETYFFEGDHDDFLEDRIARVMVWFDEMRDDEDDYWDDDSDDFWADQEDVGLSDAFLPGKLATEGPQVRFAVVKSGQVEIVIYDLRGRQTRRLVDRHLSSGEHSVIWDGRTDTGRPVAAGVYFAQMLIDTKAVDSGKILLLR